MDWNSLTPGSGFFPWQDATEAEKNSAENNVPIEQGNKNNYATTPVVLYTVHHGPKPRAAATFVIYAHTIKIT
jgi:hypothetical protein